MVRSRVRPDANRAEYRKAVWCHSVQPAGVALFGLGKARLWPDGRYPARTRGRRAERGQSGYFERFYTVTAPHPVGMAVLSGEAADADNING